MSAQLAVGPGAPTAHYAQSDPSLPSGANSRRVATTRHRQKHVLVDERRSIVGSLTECIIIGCRGGCVVFLNKDLMPARGPQAGRRQEVLFQHLSAIHRGNERNVEVGNITLNAAISSIAGNATGTWRSLPRLLRATYEPSSQSPPTTSGH